MRLAITGASGNLGRLVIDALPALGVPASSIVAAVRSLEKATDLVARGVDVRHADYEQPDTLVSAFDGVERLLLISSNEVGQRTQLHQNVVDAAVAADVKAIAYTSIVGADSTAMRIAAEHRATEDMIRASDIPFTFLRNAWYMDLYVDSLPRTITQGELVGSAGNGRISAALRSDFATAAATVLAGELHENLVYELGGDEAFTMEELAAEISEQTGKRVVYRNLQPEAHVEFLTGLGLPEPAAVTFADADAGVARGDLYVDSGDLGRLIGRPTVRLADAIAAKLRG